MKYPSSSLRPSSILSPTRNIDVVAEMTELLAKRKAEYEEEVQLLAEDEGLLPQQAPPKPSSALIPRPVHRSAVLPPAAARI